MAIFDLLKTVGFNDCTIVSTWKSYGLQMTHCAPAFPALSQSPAVKEVLKDQDGRKGLIAAICAGTDKTNCSHNYAGATFNSEAFLSSYSLNMS